jgi:hypothetical protein
VKVTDGRMPPPREGVIAAGRNTREGDRRRDAAPREAIAARADQPRVAASVVAEWVPFRLT